MVTINDKAYKSDLMLSSILYAMKKEALLQIAKRLDFRSSPNVTKDKVASGLAAGMPGEPLEIVARLSRRELLL